MTLCSYRGTWIASWAVDADSDVDGDVDAAGRGGDGCGGDRGVYGKDHVLPSFAYKGQVLGMLE